MLFIGDDWSEAHHDAELVDDSGRMLARRRLPEGVAGLSGLHELIAEHLGDDDEPGSVVVGIETDRGPWVTALVAAGYQVFAINPVQVARYRERHSASGAKSDRGDAHTLAEVVRLDRAHHRALVPDSTLSDQIRVLTRSHQTMIWTRRRQANMLRSTLREFYPAALATLGDDLTDRDAVAVLAAAPSPAKGQALTRSRISAVLRRAGRKRNVDAAAERIQAGLRSPQLGEVHTFAESAVQATRHQTCSCS
jgi:transposase